MSIEATFKIELDNFTLDVDLNIPAQGISAIFGPSGSGKTTLLRAIAGLERHSGAYLKVKGSIWQDETTFVPPHQRSLAYVFQEASLFEHLNVEGNLAYGLKRSTKQKSTVSLQQAIELFDLGHLLKRKPTHLSGGERQRVAIARALAVSPELLLMDEPLASLDEKRKQEILPYIETLHKELEIPVLYVSHSPDEVARLADHLILLKGGSILGSGPISTMLTRLDLPLAHRGDAESLIEATVTGYDKKYKLIMLKFEGGSFTVPGNEIPLDSQVRLRIAAQDVSLTLHHQQGTSILNILPAIVDELIQHDSPQVTIRLKVGTVFILARVTRKSVAALNLQVGMAVFAQAKSVAVLA